MQLTQDARKNINIYIKKKDKRSLVLLSSAC